MHKKHVHFIKFSISHKVHDISTSANELDFDFKFTAIKKAVKKF